LIDVATTHQDDELKSVPPGLLADLGTSEKSPPCCVKRADKTYRALNIVTQFVEHLLPLTDSLLRGAGMVEIIELLQDIKMFVAVGLPEKFPTLLRYRICTHTN